MTYLMKCPICGHSNIRTYYTEDIGLVEDYYSCSFCGYWEAMCYSPTYKGIESKLKYIIRYLRYKNKFKKLNIKFSKNMIF